MYRPKKPEIPTNLRLPKQKAIDEDTLQFLLSEASVRRGTTIELPIQAAGGASCMLTVRLGDDGGEPVWTYCQGDDDRARVLWRHRTGDVNLVFNLCAADAAGVDNYAVASSYPSAQMPGGMISPPGKTPGAYDAHHSRDSQQNVNPALFSGSNAPSSQNLPMNAPGRSSTMQGDLSKMQISTLLQSIQMSKMTGELQLELAGSKASIYFEDGNLTDAVTAETRGDQAVIELITWEEGGFAFYPNQRSSEKTVKRRVDALLMEGITLLDQNKYLKQQGVRLQSYLSRSNPNLSEDDFKLALTKGAPIDLSLQKKFYGQIDNASTLFDILQRMPMVKNDWVPLMFNMIVCGLIQVSDVAPSGAAIPQRINLPPFEIDRAAIQGVVRQLTRPETGILSYPAFMYLLELEFHKCAAVGMPLSLLVFEPKLKVADNIQDLPSQFSRELMRKLEQVKRPFDILGHFEMFGYAMFMPNMPAKSSRFFAVRLMELFGAEPFIPRPMGQLVLYTGIAAAPEDTQDLPQLLAAAKEAKKLSSAGGSIITTFRENAV